MEIKKGIPGVDDIVTALDTINDVFSIALLIGTKRMEKSGKSEEEATAIVDDARKKLREEIAFSICARAWIHSDQKEAEEFQKYTERVIQLVNKLIIEK
jgi:uncharacterized membrane-anchored protein